MVGNWTAPGGVGELGSHWCVVAAAANLSHFNRHNADADGQRRLDVLYIGGVAACPSFKATS